jgi:hypothetical protein
MKIIIFMAILMVASVSAIEYSDDFNYGGIGNGYDYSPWVCNTGSCTENAGYIWGEGGYSQNLTDTEGMDFSNGFEVRMNFSAFNYVNTNYNILMFTNDASSWAVGDYVYVGLNIDVGDTYTNDDLTIGCAGACSCSNPVNLVASEANSYSGVVTYDAVTGNLTYVRSDANSVSTIVSGCDITTDYVVLFARSGDSSFNDFWMSDLAAACVPNWSCSSLGACNSSDVRPCLAVSDSNTCGDPFGGSLSSYDVACSYVAPSSPSSTSASRRGEVMYCDSTTNMCYTSLQEAQGGTAFASVPAGTTKNPFTAFFDWLTNLFDNGQNWP